MLSFGVTFKVQPEEPSIAKMKNENRKFGRAGNGSSSMNPNDAADYLADVLPALAQIADGAGFDELAFLLEMAVLEASTKRGTVTELRPRKD